MLLRFGAARSLAQALPAATAVGSGILVGQSTLGLMIGAVIAVGPQFVLALAACVIATREKNADDAQKRIRALTSLLDKLR
jgi:hypothetical protein